MAVFAALALAALAVHVPGPRSSGIVPTLQGGEAGGGRTSMRTGPVVASGGIRIPDGWAMLALHWALPGWAMPAPAPGPSSTVLGLGPKKAAVPVEAFPADAQDPPNARPPSPTVPPPDVYGTNPKVGIYHTGTTEAYAPAVQASGKAPSRYSRDQAVSVVQVGAVLCETLSQLGLGCVHSRAVNDPDGMLGAYENSAKTAASLLSAYPGIQVLLDLNRLAVPPAADPASPSGADAQRAAAVILVVGTDDLLPDPHWRRNLAFARVLQAAAHRLYPGWSLQVEVSPSQYNQELLPGALLVQVGNVNTPLASADRAAVRLAHVLDAVIRSGLAPANPSRPSGSQTSG